MPENAEDIAIFGDSGCRMKKGDIQACNDSTAWPLATMSNSIAKQQPDLVIFLGDFFYRDVVCPEDLFASCGGSPAPAALPFNDSALSWAADVFIPMAATLSAAPIVVVRGNHEACYRGGNGYFIYMDPRDGTEDTCAPALDSSGQLVEAPLGFTDPYAIDINVAKDRSLRLIVIDDSTGDDPSCIPGALLNEYTEAFRSAEELAEGSDEYWLLAHRPVVGWGVGDDCGPDGGWTGADVQVTSFGQLAKYDLLLSSHIHLVQSMNIPGIPGQLILGNGSTKLEDDVPFSLPTTGPSFDSSHAYPPPTSGWWDVQFGYAMAHPSQNLSWQMDMQSPVGETFAECVISQRNVDCGPTAQ